MTKAQQLNIQVPAGKKGYAFVQEFVSKQGYPTVGSISEDMLKKFYKHLDEAQLDVWVAELGGEYKRCGNESIDRMRACMAVYGVHFPKAPSEGKKSKSKYADYTTEALMDMAVSNEIVFELCDDDRILRMRAIMALRAHKIIE